MSIFLRHFYRTPRNMLFSEPVLFEIPVLPRIKKFIAAKLRDDAGRPQPLLLSPSCQGAGLFLWAMAQSEKVMLHLGYKRRHSTGGQPVFAPNIMSQSLGLGIRGFHKSRHQILFNPAELMAFSNFVDYLIYNELVCSCQENPDLALSAHVKGFCDYYDFSDEEVSERALKQKLWRNQTGQLAASLNYDISLTKVHHFQPYAYGLAA